MLLSLLERTATRTAQLLAPFLIAVALWAVLAPPASAGKLTALHDSFCAITPDTGVSCWDADDVTSPSTPPPAPDTTPTAVSGFAGMRSISGSDGRLCGVTKQRRVLCQVRNRFQAVAPPVEVPGVRDAVEVVASNRVVCVIHRSRSLSCSKDLDYPVGQVKLTRVAGADGSTAIGPAARSFCVIRTGGRIGCLSEPSFTKKPKLSSAGRVAGAVALRSGPGGICVATRTRELRCEGSRTPFAGPSLGRGSTAFTRYPGVRDILDFGQGRLCAIRSGGLVTCENPYASTPTVPSRSARLGNDPTVANVAGALEVASTRDTTCALVAGGQVTCWVTGFGPRPDSFATSPVNVPVSAGATSISAGGTHTCAIVRGGSVECWGAPRGPESGLAHQRAAERDPGRQRRYVDRDR